MSEFSLDKGNRKNGIKGLIGSIVIFVVLPLIALFLIQYIQDMVLSGISSDVDKDDINALFKIAKDVLILYLIFGIPAIVLRTLGKFYPAGNRARLTFKLLYGFYIAAWLLIITTGGVITVDATSLASSMAGESSDYTISGLTMVLDMSGLILIIVLITLFKNIIPLAEYKGARKKYLEKLNNPETDPANA
ncbi:MAG: hypothetical protein KRP56_07610 [Candidatus Methanogranum gryphiswaldense]|nr:MAG: hypothetical protein KRP56_07610 [Candidatus Methanogranum sp. U3.2.1]